MARLFLVLLVAGGDFQGRRLSMAWRTIFQIRLVLRLPTCSPLLHPLPLLLSSSSPSSLVLRPLLLFYAAADLVAISIVLSLLSYASASSTTKKTRSSDLFLSHPCPSSSPTTIFCRSFPHDRNDHHRNPDPVSPPPAAAAAAAAVFLPHAPAPSGLGQPV
ncbi:hypothetical protein RIF29_38583 [Crotalaria pallida]|uniref:Uncharacterized protein n=1 Tax=Crotalaria pallida TaxID=3830 RepID=A0AAN9E5T6_CROPI